MEIDPQERDSDIGDESPVSQHDEDISDGESADQPEDADSCDELRRHNSLLADHGDVLAKLKMQVRDIKVGEDYENGRQLAFPLGGRAGVGVAGAGAGGGVVDGFQLPVPFPFPHPAAAAAAAAAFLPPMSVAQQQTTAPPSSGSSHSSEGSASSQHTWSFEEQFKQLYEINDDPKRKEFLDDLFSFMQKRGTPINRLPIMAKSVLDLYELYNLVIARGGLVDVINKKLWQEIIKGLHLPSSITSAAFTLRTQYMKYLYPYECDKRRLSTPSELQAAIDGNRREGRRSSYGQYDTMHRSPGTQMSSLALVTQHQQQQQHLARINSVMSGGIGHHNGAHHPTHPTPLGQPLVSAPVAGLAPHEFEARMMDYLKLLNKEVRSTATTPPRSGGAASPIDTTVLNPLEIQSRMTLWSLYNNNHNNNQTQFEPQKEALNLSDVAPLVKREQELREPSPPAKRFVKEEEPQRQQQHHHQLLLQQQQQQQHNHVNAVDREQLQRSQPQTPKSLSPNNTHIKINTKGDTRSGDNTLAVSMELNGITYSGVLFPQTAAK